MKLFRRLAVLATAADAIRRYAKNNPEQFSKLVDRATGFVDHRTNGKYSRQIGTVSQKIKDITGATSAASASQPHS